MPFKITSVDNLVKRTEIGFGCDIGVAIYGYDPEEPAEAPAGGAAEAPAEEPAEEPAVAEKIVLKPVEEPASFAASVASHAHMLDERIQAVIGKINASHTQREEVDTGLRGSSVARIYIGVSGVFFKDGEGDPHDPSTWVTTKTSSSTISRWKDEHQKDKVGMVIIGAIDKTCIPAFPGMSPSGYLGVVETALHYEFKLGFHEKYIDKVNDFVGAEFEAGPWLSGPGGKKAGPHTPGGNGDMVMIYLCWQLRVPEAERREINRKTAAHKKMKSAAKEKRKERVKAGTPERTPKATIIINGSGADDGLLEGSGKFAA